MSSDIRAVVTGATSGIGRALVPELVARGYAVTIAGRNRAAAEAVRDDVLTRYPDAHLELADLDLADLTSVRALVEREHDRPLDLLVNNAGLSSATAPPTAQRYEPHWGVMHLGHAALTLGLLSALDSRGGRFLTVAAYGYRLGRFDPATTVLDKPINAYAAYCQAKLARLAVDQPASDSGGYFSYHTFTRRMPTGPTRIVRRARRPQVVADILSTTRAQLEAAGFTVEPDKRATAQ